MMEFTIGDIRFETFDVPEGTVMGGQEMIDYAKYAIQNDNGKKVVGKDEYEFLLENLDKISPDVRFCDLVTECPVAGDPEFPHHTYFLRWKDAPWIKPCGGWTFGWHDLEGRWAWCANRIGSRRVLLCQKI